MGPELIPLLVSAAGTVATVSAEQEQASNQRKILNRQLERDDKASQKNTQMVQDEGQRFAMQDRQQGLQQQEAKSYDQTQADLNGAGGASIGTAADSANTSDDFLKTRAQRSVDEGNRLTSIAREAAKARAPGMLGQEDALSLANLGGNQSNLWGGTKNMAGASGLDAQSVQMPGYGALGKIATAAGGAMAAGGYGQPAAQTGMEGGVPNPYATGPYRKAAGGINFGAR